MWHPQYNGFAGFVFFKSDDQRALPWMTTKRDLDVASPLYRRALVRMKTITDAFIAYTNARTIPTKRESKKPRERRPTSLRL